MDEWLRIPTPGKSGADKSANRQSHPNVASYKAIMNRVASPPGTTMGPRKEKYTRQSEPVIKGTPSRRPNAYLQHIINIL